MNKTSWFIIGITVLIIGGGIFLFSRSSSNSSSPALTNLPSPTKSEYYWRVGCEHCQNVDNFLATWVNKDKVQWDKFEVTDNTNAQRMIARAVSCKLDPNQVGTPLLFTPDGKCIDGDTPIIDYLKSTIK
jgi:glutaredoxin